MLAAALAAEFRDPVRVADEARFIIRRRSLDGLVGIYVPPPPNGTRPGLILGLEGHGANREAMYALAIGHYFLFHDTYVAYPYSAAGALYLNAQEEDDVREFAAAFLRAMPIAPVVKKYARG